MSRLGLRLHADEEHWIPLSDLMTGLMLLFLLISLAYMVEVQLRGVKQTAAQQSYQRTRAALARELRAQLTPDLRRWNAQFDERTLTVRFAGRNVLFAAGSARLQPQFARALREFFPRYVAILNQPAYRDLVRDVRIEGFTSRSWRPGATLSESYLGNMALSQDRARSVLSYVLMLPAIRPQRDWLMNVASTAGFSFSHLVRNANGSENADASERVEFHVLLAAPTVAGAGAAAQAAPPYPAWSAALLGKPLRLLFPKTTLRCIGGVDGVVAEYRGPGAQLDGWGFDLVANAPLQHVIFVDPHGTIVGAAGGGLTRTDVEATIPRITSPSTGWRGYVPSASPPVAAWGIMRAPATVCRLQTTAPGGRGM